MKQDSSLAKIIKISIICGADIIFILHGYTNLKYTFFMPYHNIWIFAAILLFPAPIVYFWIKDTQKNKLLYASIWPGFILACILIVFLLLLSLAGI